MSDDYDGDGKVTHSASWEVQVLAGDGPTFVAGIGRPGEVRLLLLPNEYCITSQPASEPTKQTNFGSHSRSFQAIISLISGK